MKFVSPRWSRAASGRSHDWIALLGSILAGIGALGFVLSARWSLGLENFAPLAHVWAAWSISAAVITFAYQQSAVIASLSPSRSRPVSIAPVLILSVTIFTLTFWNRTSLFGTDALHWPILCASLPYGSLFTGWARGRAAARESKAQLFSVVAGENLVRAALGLGLLVVSAEPFTFALVVAAGYVVAFTPFLARSRSSEKREGDQVLGAPWTGTSAGLAAHSLLVLGPSFLAVGGLDPNAVSGLFIVLAVYRAPYQLVMGYAPRLIFRIESLRRSKPYVLERLSLPFLMLATLGATAVGGVAIGLLGDQVIDPLFGLGNRLGLIDHVLAASLPIVVSGALVLTIVLIDHVRSGALAVAWIAPSAAALAGLFLASPTDPTTSLLVLVGTATLIFVFQSATVRLAHGEPAQL